MSASPVSVDLDVLARAAMDFLPAPIFFAAVPVSRSI
jgi:hypothetical protein